MGFTGRHGGLRETANRSFFLTTKCARPYYDETFEAGIFCFGRETKGLPESLLAENEERLLTIPMRPQTRSLNLATAVANRAL